MSLFEVAAEYQLRYDDLEALQDSMDTILAQSGGEVTPEFLDLEQEAEHLQQTLLSKQQDEESAVHSYINRIRWHEAQAKSEEGFLAEVEKELQRYAKRVSKHEKRAEWLRNGLRIFLDACHDGKTKTARYDLSNRNWGTGSVVIVDKDSLPAEFVIVETKEVEKIDKTGIKKRQDAGIDVPGAVRTEPVRKTVWK